MTNNLPYKPLYVRILASVAYAAMLALVPVAAQMTGALSAQIFAGVLLFCQVLVWVPFGDKRGFTRGSRIFLGLLATGMLFYSVNSGSPWFFGGFVITTVVAIKGGRKVTAE